MAKVMEQVQCGDVNFPKEQSAFTDADTDSDNCGRDSTKAAVLHHALTLADDLLAQSVAPMIRWLDMGIELNEELREGLGMSK